MSYIVNTKKEKKMGRKLLLVIVLVAFSMNIGAQTKGTLTVNVTTQTVPVIATPSSANNGPTGGRGVSRSYAPQNILAIWVEDSNGKFVKTLLVNARRYNFYLTAWQSVTSAAESRFNSVDAITGATNMNHGTRSCTWDGTDYNGKLVADGTYKVCMELTESNSTGNSTSFTITKGSKPVELKPESNTNFTAITLKWNPTVPTTSRN